MIQINNVSLAYGEQKIFDNLTWHVKPEKKIGLVGANGAGKTTLFKLITGEVEPDSGEVSHVSPENISYLPQEFREQSTGNTVLEEALGTFKKICDIEREAENIADEMKDLSHDSDKYKKCLARLDRIQTELAARDSHRIKYRTEKMLMGLGFDTDDFSEPLGTFSGGWRMRVELAKLLLRDPETILLDEPTNHLDIESISWFEEYLDTFQGTVILVSHDRYFLDRMSESTAELFRGKITEYEGNYSYYLEERKSRIANQKSAYENQQREIREMERFIERFRYNASKASQVQSRIKMLEKMDKIPPPPSEPESIRLEFPAPTRSGNRVMELSEFSKTYRSKNNSNNDVFKEAGPLTIWRGDKIALVGKNASGKSTLARILAGEEPFDGERIVGYNVEITHFAQHLSEALDPSKNVIEEIKSDSKSGNETRIRSLLGSFLFTEDDVFKPISVLSGGEKSRVALAKILISPKNFMVLDEPTNHLDIQSRGVLIQALKQYPGTFVVVSHDRHFLDQIVNKVWYVRSGKVEVFRGTYSEFQDRQANQGVSFENENSKPSGIPSKNVGEGPESEAPSDKQKEEKRREAEERNRMHRELKELGIENMDNWRKLSPNQLSDAISGLEKKIERKEEQRSEIESLLSDPGFYEDKERSDTVTREYAELKKELESLYERWTSISTHLESEDS